MEARSERLGGILILIVSGRLDAFGARQLDEAVRKDLHDDDRDLVLDVTDSPYLSSGGIRVFLTLKREMDRRKGRFALAGVGEYSKKVLAMAGFINLFEAFETVQEAVDDIAGDHQYPPSPERRASKTITDGDVTLAVESGWIAAHPALRVQGSLDKLLHARLKEEDIRSKRFGELDYSLGLGALGTSLGDAMSLLGEMITLHGSMVWLPTDGHSTPATISRSMARSTSISSSKQGESRVYLSAASTGRSLPERKEG
jgi:anti-anti-sigma factor